MQNKYVFSVVILCMFSCKPKLAETNKALLYFDLSSFFKNETVRLNNLKPTVSKVVSINANRETKQLKITDWEKELAIFANADINKGAWKGSFKSTKTADGITYEAIDRKIPVKKLSVKKTNKEIQEIQIIIDNKNWLYHSIDTLNYSTEKSYSIIKHQKIKLLEPKSYRVFVHFLE